MTRSNKALYNKAETSTQKKSWEEIVPRSPSILSKHIQTAESFLNFSGSWAANWSIGGGVITEKEALLSNAYGKQQNLLGLPGFPEINFRPYDFNTNRNGKYPSLLGHPISFEVIGPTLKTPFNDFQWLLDKSGAADILELDTLAASSTDGNTVLTNYSSIEDIYGTIDTSSGVYLVISQTGSPSELSDIDGSDTTGEGGLGDGTIGSNPTDTLTRDPIAPLNDKSKFEIFAVAEIGATTLTLASNKRISDYFTVPTDSAIRAITLIRPRASRCVVIPGSNNQVYAIMPPDTALTSDNLHPYLVHNSDGDFCVWDGYNNASGTSTGHDKYSENVALPIPRAISNGTGRLQGFVGNVVVYENPNLLSILVPSNQISSSNEGQILKINDIQIKGEPTLSGGGLIGEPEIASLIGYYEIKEVVTDVSENLVHLYRVTEINPKTGCPFEAPSETFVLKNASTNDNVYFSWTLHNKIGVLYEQARLNIDDLLSTKLSNLIDPVWVENPTMKSKSNQIPYLGKPDKCVFDTSANANGYSNPGSLLDLGFRAVLFPGMILGGEVIPDFSNPLDSNNLILDSSLEDTNQYYEVDYAAGLIYLSHAPNYDSDECSLGPDTVLTASNNPRGEPVIFCCCVPYTMEPSQQNGIRVSSVDYDSVRTGNSYKGSYSALGSRYFAKVDSYTATSSPDKFDLTLSDPIETLLLPPVGFVDLVRGSFSDGDSAHFDNDTDRNFVNTIGYGYIDNSGPTTILKNCYGLVPGYSYTYDVTDPITAVFRKNIFLPSSSTGDNGPLTHLDVSYGNALKVNNLKFRNAELNYLQDGSVEIDTKDKAFEKVFSTIFDANLLSGGQVSSPLGLFLTITEATTIYLGKRGFLETTSLSMPSSSTRYVYIDLDDPTRPSVSLASVLTDIPNNCIVLAKVVSSFISISSITDLRNPISSLNKRLEILVGKDPEGNEITHFETLSQAIKFVGEIAEPSSGLDGRYFSIKVIGMTEEVNLPIRIPCDGLVIEGYRNLIPTNPTVSGTMHGIQWEEEHLFDLNSKSNLTFRNLCFILKGAQVTDTNPICSVFYNGDGNPTLSSVSQNIFENLVIYGDGVYPQGVYYNEGGDSGGTIDFTLHTFRNIVAYVSDFLMRVDTTTMTATYSNFNIDQCAVYLANNTMTDYVIKFDADGANNVVQNINMSGGHDGIYVNTVNTEIKNILISGFDTIGSVPIVVGSNANNCSIKDIFIEDGPVTIHGVSAYGVGILLNAISFISNIDITMSTLVRTDTVSATSTLAIEDLIGSSILNNVKANASIKLGPSSILENSTVTGNIFYDTGVKINNNIITGSLADDGIVSINEIKITNNQISNDIGLSSTPSVAYSSVISGNSFTDINLEIENTSVSSNTFRNCTLAKTSKGNSVISNNVITGTAEFDLEDSIISSNYIGGATVDLLGSNLNLSGNVIIGVVTAGASGNEASGINLSGNNISDDIDMTYCNNLVMLCNTVDGQLDVGSKDSWVVLGNNITGGITATAGDPDSAPFTSFLLGNKLGNSGTGQFGGATDSLGRGYNGA